MLADGEVVKNGECSGVRGRAGAAPGGTYRDRVRDSVAEGAEAGLRGRRAGRRTAGGPVHGEWPVGRRSAEHCRALGSRPRVT